MKPIKLRDFDSFLMNENEEVYSELDTKISKTLIQSMKKFGFTNPTIVSIKVVDGYPYKWDKSTKLYTVKCQKGFAYLSYTKDKVLYFSFEGANFHTSVWDIHWGIDNKSQCEEEDIINSLKSRSFLSHLETHNHILKWDYDAVAFLTKMRDLFYEDLKKEGLWLDFMGDPKKERFLNTSNAIYAEAHLFYDRSESVNMSVNFMEGEGYIHFFKNDPLKKFTKQVNFYFQVKESVEDIYSSYKKDFIKTFKEMESFRNKLNADFAEFSKSMKEPWM